MLNNGVVVKRQAICWQKHNPLCHVVECQACRADLHGVQTSEGCTRFAYTKLSTNLLHCYFHLNETSLLINA